MNELPGLAADRLKRAVFAFVRELFPQQDFFGFYIYSVAAWDNANQIGDLVPAATTSGLPPVRCPIRLPGMKVNLAVGQEVLVGFDNHDPTRPFIAHLGTLGTGLFPIATTLEAAAIKIGDGATLGAARQTDTVNVGTLAFNPGSGGATLTYNGTPVTTPISITGTITSSSAKVSVE
jgi:hypothetical protein